jgi:hypothetical protein
VTRSSDDRLPELPNDVQALLAAAPLTEKKLLELGISWPHAAVDSSIEQAFARMAAALRVFVITWDPLETHAPRPDALATVNADPSGLELVVYLPCWSLAGLADKRNATAAEALALVAGSAVMTAATHEQAVLSGDYPDLVRSGAAPDLLNDPDLQIALGPAEIGLVSKTWEEIGLGAITDLVQHAFGYVDLDRSRVELAPVPSPRPSCPACRGRRFGFPADLGESRDRMCAQHRRESTAVINRRLARANASNPVGWGELTDATMRREVPHLPNGLATRLAGAEEGMYVIPERDVLAERAALVIEAASWFDGRPRDLSLALGQEEWAADLLPDWLVTLPLDLGRAGLAAEATAVGDALARVDPDGAATHQADVAVALAEAGLADQVHARLAALLERWPDDFWCRVHAGDALAALGDIDGAAAHFVIAQRMAEDADDFEARSDAVERLSRLRRLSQAGSGPEPPRPERHQPRRKLSRDQRARRNRKR